MTYDELVDAIERETSGLSDAFARGAVDARVATCPDWDVRDLAHHVGEFTAFWTHVACEASGQEKTPYEPVPPDDSTALGRWYQALARNLVAALRNTSGEQPSWTWVPSQQHVGFVARRCANELAMHRYDAQSARSACEPIDAALATECVLEIPALLEGWSVGGGYEHEGSGRVLHLCATEPDHELVLKLQPGRLEIANEHTDAADLTMRGTMSDLALVAFDRPPLGNVDKVGDEGMLRAWYAEFHFG